MVTSHIPTINGLLSPAWLPAAAVAANGAIPGAPSASMGASFIALMAALLATVGRPHARACGTNVMHKAAIATVIRVADWGVILTCRLVFIVIISFAFPRAPSGVCR